MNNRIGKVENDGTVRDEMNNHIGRIESNGTVRDSNDNILGYAKDVPMRWAAVIFFF